MSCQRTELRVIKTLLKKLYCVSYFSCGEGKINSNSETVVSWPNTGECGIECSPPNHRRLWCVIGCWDSQSRLGSTQPTYDLAVLYQRRCEFSLSNQMPVLHEQRTGSKSIESKTRGWFTLTLSRHVASIQYLQKWDIVEMCLVHHF